MALNAITRTAQRIVGNSGILLSSRSSSLWTSDNIVKSPHKDVVIPNRTVVEHVWEDILKWADKTALVCGVTNRSITYQQLYKYSRNFAAQLRTQLKIRDGDVVCIMMPNSPEYGVAMLGILEAGAEVTTINPIYTAHEVHRQLVLANPNVVIGVPSTIKVLKEALQLAQKDLPIIGLNDGTGLPSGVISFQEFVIDSNPDLSVLKEVSKKPEDIAFLPYSSGTTGLPKGVELTNRNVVANCVQQESDPIKFYNDTTSLNQDATLAVLPFYHIYGLVIILLHKLSAGLKVVTLPKFQPDSFLSTLKEHKIQLLCAAPPMVLFLGSHPDVKKEHLESIKTITSGAAPLPRNDVQRVLEKVQPDTNLLQIYGLTETSPLATAMLRGSTAYSTAGYAIANTQLRVVDSDLRSLEPNQVGELLIRGPQVMKGYRNNPEATKAVITEGWFRSGDLASLGKDGVVTIVDRLKELIKVKGYQVPPAELENILKEHPAVLDAAVVGMPDKKAGEVPKAFIVKKDGVKVQPEDIIKFVAERVAEFKRIKEVTFLDELPKNPSGKILRRVLKDKYC
ncbi:probable 4-coumarate--CoA ligase 3 isoform X2 [Manduca sexta]|nr:probable 4-coumarate--CoA ligase 3 isoform X2 [Manduca sexta]